MEITQEKIEEWRQKHGDVYRIEVAENALDFSDNLVVSTQLGDDEPTLKAYIKKPDNQTLSRAYALMREDPYKAGLTILKNGWLGGDERLRTDVSYAMAAAQEALTLVDVRLSKIKKL